MVGTTNIAPVSNKLHSAEHLTNSEESEDLTGNNDTGSDLGTAGVADSGDWRLAEDGSWVSDQVLVEGLEGGHWSTIELLAYVTQRRISLSEYLRESHVLSLEDELGKLKTDASIVDGWWDLSYIRVSYGPTLCRAPSAAELSNWRINVLSTKAMSFPVRPPILPRALETPLTAPLMAGPAADVAFDKPSEALDWKFCADSDALDAASEAFADVVLLRRATREVNLADCLITARETDITILKYVTCWLGN